MRDLGNHRYECTACNARILVTFSEAPPVVTIDERRQRRERVVTISDVEVHRCAVGDER